MNAFKRTVSFGGHWAARLIGPVVRVFTVLVEAVTGWSWTGGGPQAVDPIPSDVKAAIDTPPGHKRWRRRRRFR